MFNSARVAGLALVLGLLVSCGKPSPPSALAPPSTPAIADARRLLAEAGFPEGRGFPKLEILHNTAEWHKKIAAAIQEMWRKELGIATEIRNEEWKVFLDSRAKGRYQIARGGYTGEYRDPQAFLSLFTADSSVNSTGWSSAGYDRLLATADSETDPAKRFAILAKAERLLLDECPVFPVFHYVSHNYVKPFVKGVHPNYRDLHPHRDITLSGDGAPADGVLVFYAGEEASSLDPALSHDIRGLKTAMELFEGLLSYDPRDAMPVSGMAESWYASKDGLTWTFHLKPSTWSNGEAVTAGDFVYSWRRVIDPKTASQYKNLFHFIKNGRAIGRGEAPVDTLGVRAVDDRTLEVVLEHPTPYILQVLCLNVFYPVHRATVEKHGVQWTRPENMVNNGPFRLVEWKVNDRQVFAKNPAYRDAPSVRLKKFIWLTGSDIAAAFAQYESGACHWTYQAPTERMDELVKRPDHLAGPYNTSYFYAFNTRVKPLDDVRVRRALSLAVDREKIAKYVMRGGETPADRITPMLIPGYEVK